MAREYHGLQAKCARGSRFVRSARNRSRVRPTSLVMQNNTDMQGQERPSTPKDPAQVWWNDAAPKTQYVAPPPPLVEQPWRWRYSPWVGIMYGPIPVGLIIGLPLLLALTMK
jgi:hypothetical protein